MSTFVHPVALAVAFVAITGVAAAQSNNSGNTGGSTSGMWEDNTTNATPQIDRGIAERCNGSNCPSSGNARPGASRGTSGASAMPGDTASRPGGTGNAVPAGSQDGAVYRQW